MKVKISIIVVLLFTYSHIIIAQYDAKITNHWAISNYYNPAFAGKSGKLDLTALVGQEMVGFKGLPQTMVVSGHMPLKLLGRTHGVGAMVVTEKMGLFKHSLMAAQYVYQKKVWKGTLHIGVQGGMLDRSFDGTKAHTQPVIKEDGNEKPIDDEYHKKEDEDIPIALVSGKSVDFNLGVLYYRKNWHVGFSVTHLLAPEISLGDNHFTKLPRGYYLMGGYNIQLNNPLLELQPSALFKSSSLIPGLDSTAMVIQLDLSALLVYNKTFFGGLGWRAGYTAMFQSTAAFAIIGGRFKNFELGYAYDFPTSAIRMGSMGNHEIVLKYVIDLNLGKGDKNKHKSVRIL